MKHMKTTSIIIFALLSSIFFCSSLLQAPSSRAFSCTGFTMTGAIQNGTSNWFYGEKDQKVSFAATFDEDNPTGFVLNVTWNNWTGFSTNPVTSMPGNIRGVVYNDYPLDNTLTGENQTWQFKISRLGSGPEYTTPEIVINIADAFAPANATNVALTKRPNGGVQITWAAGVQYYADLGAYARDNVEVFQWDILRRKTYDITSPSQTAPFDTVGPNVFEYLDTSVPTDELYFYQIIAHDRAEHNSSTHAPISIHPDRVSPTLVTYELNGTSYKETSSHINVATGALMKLKFKVSEDYITGSIIMRTTYNGYDLQFVYSMTENLTGHFLWLDLETTPIGLEALPIGTYDITLNFTDSAGNQLILEYPGQLSITPPPNPLLEMLLIIAAIAAGGVAVGFVAVKKLKQKRAAEAASAGTPSSKKRRGGEIFKGASDLGRSSGDEAEEILAKRKRSPASAADARTTVKRSPEKSRSPTTSSQALSSSLESGSEIPTAKPEKFETISSTTGMKEIRAIEKAQITDVGKKSDFIAGRVTNLENVMSIAVNLVEMVPETNPCEKCGKPLNPSWNSCPWCLTSAQSDELEMKLAISGIDGKKASVCPTCRAPLLPGWVKCPYCAIRKA